MKDKSSWFSYEKNGWWGMTPCTWNFGPNWPHSFENAIINLFSIVTLNDFEQHNSPYFALFHWIQ